jgi:hypothetical protein
MSNIEENNTKIENEVTNLLQEYKVIHKQIDTLSSVSDNNDNEKIKNIHICSNIGTYTGESDNGIAQGFGKWENTPQPKSNNSAFSFDKMSRYLGFGNKSVSTTSSKKNVFIYKGQWKNNMANGYGEMEYPNNIKYIGEWNENKCDGVGSLIYNNDNYISKYICKWENNVKNGVGCIIYKNGDLYQGNINYNIIEGKGKRFYVIENSYQYQNTFITSELIDKLKNRNISVDNINIYEGDFKYSVPFGEGTIIYGSFKPSLCNYLYRAGICISNKDNEKYNITIKNYEELLKMTSNIDDKEKYYYNNFQILTLDDIKLYFIRADKDKINDNDIEKKAQEFKNILSYPNPFTYKGYFKWGIPDTDQKQSGEITYPNRNKYEGQVRNGVPHGQGRMTYNNNSKYNGGWMYGMKNGIGEYTQSDENTINQGWWQNNDFTSSNPNLLNDKDKDKELDEGIEEINPKIEQAEEDIKENKSNNESKSITINDMEGKFEGKKIKLVSKDSQTGGSINKKYNISNKIRKVIETHKIKKIVGGNAGDGLPNNPKSIKPVSVISSHIKALFGTWKKSDNIFYTGYLNDNLKPHFYGKLQKSPNNIYIGNFDNGKKNGIGELKTTTYTYSGHFKNDVKSGYGIIKYNYGYTQKGIWENDQLVVSIWIDPSVIEKVNKNTANAYLPNIKVEQAQNILDILNKTNNKNKKEKNIAQKHLVLQKKNLEKMEMKKPINIFINGKDTEGNYIGEIKNDKANGIGYWISNNNNKLKVYGTFKDNTINGLALIIYSENHFYQGEIIDRKKNGQGRLTNYDKETLQEGTWKDDKFILGISYNKKNIQIKGLNITNYLIKIQDRAFYNYKNFSPINITIGLSKGEYKGPQENNLPHGYGCWISNDKDEIYRGGWKNGERYGMGKMIYRSGNTYSGQWDNNLANGKGTMIYNNGNKYTGEWIDNERNGYGEMTYNDNGIYKGYFLADKKHGEGTYENKETDDYYRGYFIDDARFETFDSIMKNAEYLANIASPTDGKSSDSTEMVVKNTDESKSKDNEDDNNNTALGNVPITLKNDGGEGKYAGQMSNGKANGLGKWVSNDNTKQYIGKWSENNLDGYAIYKDGENTYEGSFTNMKRNGLINHSINNGPGDKQLWIDDTPLSDKLADLEQNIINLQSNIENINSDTITQNNNNVVSDYTGKITNDKANGYGILIDNDNTRYEGQWKNGLKNGFGKYTYSDKKEYIGNFENDKIHGFGRFTYVNGDIYEGMFNNNNKQGAGKMTQNDCTIYLGLWNENKKNGYGRISHYSGNTYEGLWSQNKIDGIGTITEPSGDIYIGELENNMSNGKGIRIYPTGEVHMGTIIDKVFYGPLPIIYNDYNEAILRSSNLSEDLEIDVDKSSININSNILKNYPKLQKGPEYKFVTPTNLSGYYKGSILYNYSENIHADGYGIFYDPSNKTEYIGKWSNSNFDIGVVVDKENNNKYYGKMKDNNSKHGVGKIIYDTYVSHGRWNNNEYIGPNNKVHNSIIKAIEQSKNIKDGILINDSIIYYGQQTDKKANGYGIGFNINNKNVYLGEWKQNNMDGFGMMTYGNGDIYKGGWTNNVRNGDGTIIYNIGGYYKGNWGDDKRNGLGTLIKPNGTIQKGTWKDENFDPNGVTIPTKEEEIDKSSDIPSNTSSDMPDMPTAQLIKSPIEATNVKYTGKIPDSLTITLHTGIQGYSTLNYLPSMSIPNTNSKVIRFDPLVDLNTSAINNINSKFIQKQFFNRGLFDSLIQRVKQSIRGHPVDDLNVATEKNYIDNNIQLTIDTLLPQNGVIYINDKPYTIYRADYDKSSWHLDAKPVVDIPVDNRDIVGNTLLNKQITDAKNEINNMPENLKEGKTAQKNKPLYMNAIPTYSSTPIPKLATHSVKSTSVDTSSVDPSKTPPTKVDTPSVDEKSTSEPPQPKVDTSNEIVLHKDQNLITQNVNTPTKTITDSCNDPKNLIQADGSTNNAGEIKTALLDYFGCCQYYYVVWLFLLELYNKEKTTKDPSFLKLNSTNMVNYNNYKTNISDNWKIMTSADNTICQVISEGINYHNKLDEDAQIEYDNISGCNFTSQIICNLIDNNDEVDTNDIIKAMLEKLNLLVIIIKYDINSDIININETRYDISKNYKFKKYNDTIFGKLENNNGDNIHICSSNSSNSSNSKIKIPKLTLDNSTKINLKNSFEYIMFLYESESKYYLMGFNYDKSKYKVIYKVDNFQDLSNIADYEKIPPVPILMFLYAQSTYAKYARDDSNDFQNLYNKSGLSNTFNYLSTPIKRIYDITYVNPDNDTDAGTNADADKYDSYSEFEPNRNPFIEIYESLLRPEDAERAQSIIDTTRPRSRTASRRSQTPQVLSEQSQSPRGVTFSSNEDSAFTFKSISDDRKGGAKSSESSVNPRNKPRNNPYTNPYRNPYRNPYMNPYTHPYMFDKHMSPVIPQASLLEKGSDTTYNIDVNLVLYPGESIPLKAKPNLICNSNWEKIRRNISDIRGTPYKPNPSISYEQTIKAKEDDKESKKKSK